MAVIRPRVTIDERGVTQITWPNITTADTAGAAFVGDLDLVSIHQQSGGAGTAQLRGSNDGSNFVNMGAALAANTLTALPTPVNFIDFNPIGGATVSLFVKGVKAN